MKNSVTVKFYSSVSLADVLPPEWCAYQARLLQLSYKPASGELTISLDDVRTLEAERIRIVSKMRTLTSDLQIMEKAKAEVEKKIEQARQEPSKVGRNAGETVHHTEYLRLQKEQAAQPAEDCERKD